MSCECDTKAFASAVPRSYARYYDSPDGCDVETKALVAARYGAVTGLMLGTYDVLLYSNSVGFKNILKRYAFHVVPLTLMGATFALVSHAMLRLREKDDKLNYFVGGAACSPILAAYLGSVHAIFPAGVLLGIAGVVKKTTVENDWTLFPDWPLYYRPHNSWRHDYTLMPDPRDTMLHSCPDPDYYKK